MTKIRTAEDVLKDWITSPEGGWEPSDREAVIEAMKEYAKQFIDMAAEECEPITDLTTDQIAEIPVNDKESILKLKERVV